MQVRQAREQYVRWLVATRDLSPHTIRAYEADIGAFERHVGGGARVDAIDRDRVAGFVDELREAGLAPASIRRRASGVRGFCRWLCARELLPADPWLGTTLVAGRARKLPRFVPGSQLTRLFASLRLVAGLDDTSDAQQILRRPHESTTLLAVALMVATGARVSEIVGIKCHDIDFGGGSLRIVGKGRRERQVFLTNDWIAGLTRSYIDARARLEVRHTHLLFNTRKDPLTSAALRSRLALAANEADLDARVTPHMLRHTAATQLIEAGVDIRSIQRLLGHASLTTTEIYTHVSDPALRRVVSDADVLGRMLQQR
jgi:integrase/recombinase XerD